MANSNIVYSNVQKLSGSGKNRLINRVAPDFFDLIIVDEAHHAPANSWIEVLNFFSSAKKLHVTGTPFRGDGQEVPGELIHETALSEVMRDRYVKWLRKETVNAHRIYFTLENTDGFPIQMSLFEVMDLKEREWIERSVALSEDCSLDVIDHSIKSLNILRENSPKVPHKILAVGCSIKHAIDLDKWYSEKGLRTIIVHSDMPEDEKDNAFVSIDNHNCDVVISVDMLREGYDHQYLSILAIFRPYRSLNAFAQIVGRVLRKIPDNEITAFELDNNALVIYHEEIGLNSIWEYFQKETNRAKHPRIVIDSEDDYFSDEEYEKRSELYATVSTVNTFISGQDSFLKDIDFNKLFEQQRQEIQAAVEIDLAAIQANRPTPLSSQDADDLKEFLIRQQTRRVVAEDIDPILLEKRPALARKELRSSIKKKNEEEATNLLADLSLEPKNTEIAVFFIKKAIMNGRGFDINSANDGAIVRYINMKLHLKYGGIDLRDNDTLVNSLNEVPKILDELRKILKGL